MIKNIKNIIDQFLALEKINYLYTRRSWSIISLLFMMIGYFKIYLTFDHVFTNFAQQVLFFFVACNNTSNMQRGFWDKTHKQ